MPAAWQYKVQIFDPLTSSYMEETVQTEPKLQAAAEEEMQAASGNDLVLVEGEAPWEWHVIGTREEVDPNAPTDGHVFNYRTWSMDKDQVLHTKTEVASKTEDAPLSWLDDVLTSPDSPLSETAWRALGGGGMTASITGRWTPLTTDDGNKHSFPEGGAMEVRLRRRDVTDSTLEQPVSRSFLRVTRTGDQVTAVEGVTLTIEAGHKVSNVSTGTSTTNGSIVLKGKPDSTDTTVQVTDYLLPIEIMQPIDSSSPGEPVATSSVRMSRWFGNVRQNGSDTYDLSQVPNQDHDRIKLRIPIPSKKGQSPVTVRVSTQNCGEGFNTSPTEMELEETSANSGVFESKYPFILVADAEDDGAQYGSPSVGDGAKNDRTILARPGGKLVVQIPDLSNASVEVPIAPYRYFVEVEAVILNSGVDPWVGAGQQEVVSSQIENLKAAYAPLGIRIIPHIQTVYVNNHAEIAAAYADGKIDVTDPGLGTGYGASEHPQVISALDDLHYKTANNIVIVFTDAGIWESGLTLGGGGFAEGIALHMYGYPGWAFISMNASAASQRKYLSAHEFGHLLGLPHNGTEGGYGILNSPRTRLMSGASGNNHYTGTPASTAKRFSLEDHETIKQSEFCQPIAP